MKFILRPIIQRRMRAAVHLTATSLSPLQRIRWLREVPLSMIIVLHLVQQSGVFGTHDNWSEIAACKRVLME